MRQLVWVAVVALCSSLAFTGAVPAGGSSLGASDAHPDRDESRGWLGVSIQDVTPKFAKSKDLSVEYGAYIAEVSRNSPADSAGIQEGDVMIEFNGRSIDEAYDLQRAVGRVEPGTKVKVKIMRKEESKTLEVRVGTEERQVRRLSIVTPPRMPRIEFFSESHLDGLELMELNEQLAKYFETPEGTGVLVKKVQKGSAAEKAGFRAGDVIVKVGKRRVDDVRDLTRALRNYDKGEKADVEIMRKGSKQTLSLDVTRDLSENWFDFRVGPHRDGGMHRSFNLKMLPREDWKELRLDLDHFRPDMREFEFEMEKLHERLREIGPEIREHIERELPRIEIRSRISRSI